MSTDSACIASGSAKGGALVHPAVVAEGVTMQCGCCSTSRVPLDGAPVLVLLVRKDPSAFRPTGRDGNVRGSRELEV